MSNTAGNFTFKNCGIKGPRNPPHLSLVLAPDFSTNLPLPEEKTKLVMGKLTDVYDGVRPTSEPCHSSYLGACFSQVFLFKAT